MGGTSKTSSTESQQSQLTGYQPAMSGVNGILSALQPMTNTLGVTPGMTNAFGQIENIASNPASNPFAAPGTAAALSQLNGGANFGAATNAVTGGLNGATSALSPYTSGNALNPATNPALAQELGVVGQQVQNTVNPQFAAAGRYGSPAMAQAEATGIAQGVTPLLESAAQNQIGAGSALGAISNAAGGVLGNLDSGNAAIQTAGINNAPSAYQLQYQNPDAYLTAATQQQQQPIMNAGLLSSIYSPVAAQFGQQNVNGSSNSTSTMSPLQQLLMGSQAFGNFFGGQGAGAAGNFKNLIFS